MSPAGIRRPPRALLLALLAGLALTACEMTPKQARQALAERGYSYARADLATCVARGDSAGLELFLQAGMDPNGSTGGYAILEHAAAHPGLVARLLRAGADPGRGGGVSTPLIEAIVRGDGGSVPVLLAAGAAVDGADGTGRTALMAATQRGDTASVRRLLAAGADANLRSQLGSTPLAVARREGHDEVVDLLLAAGARDLGGVNLEALMDPAALVATSPPRYQVDFRTSAGPFRVEVERAWAPHAADRFYNLVANGYFDGQRFFRVVRGRLVQFGLHGLPEISGRWYRATIADDPATQSHRAGTLAFAGGATPDSRTTQVFINLADNADLDRTGLAPFGRVVEGLEHVRAIHDGYGELPEQERILAEGGGYLEAAFPRLDRIEQARLVP